ncbi:MAG: BNR-4 repeat-containing protein [Thermoguttaceae bacterium]|jgi:hypothetical protein
MTVFRRLLLWPLFLSLFFFTRPLLFSGDEGDPIRLLNTKDDGYRGIWYYNQKLPDNEYVYKYSGGLGTYPANHYPFAVYAPEVHKTFFCYGGTDKKGTTLLHEVGVFDHASRTVSRPTVLLDKGTEDAHDNPVISLDREGRILVFSTSHGVSRPSWIYRSVRPYDIEEFELMRPTKEVDDKTVPMTNFSYVQVWNIPTLGFVSFFTTYDRGLLEGDHRVARIPAFMKSPDGVDWSVWQPLAGMALGHYQNAGIWQNKVIGTSFNYHPNRPDENRVGLNWRTNLYYIESRDFGETWQTVDGIPLTLPLRDDQITGPALVYDYDSEKLNVYIMDLTYDNAGRPMILYITSRGFASGPESGPRVWRTAHWNGETWEIHAITESDNNYDFGSLYVGNDGILRMIGTDGIGPQAYNTGGEVSLWISRDEGKTWTRERQLTVNSPCNHCYPRRPVNAHRDFYAFWADGHGRKPSESNLFFCDIDGNVFRLPRVMEGKTAHPEKE